jgi:hypothetical protein
VGDTPYQASDWGMRFHSLTTKEALGAGSAGPGKSWVLLMDPLQQILVEDLRQNDPPNVADPNYQIYKDLQLWKYRKDRGSSEGWALHLRRTRPMLKQTINRAQRTFPLIDPGVQWVASENTFIFSSGYHYEFGHCAERDSWVNYFSQEYTWVGFDELVQFLEEQYEQISGRVRSSDPILSKMLKVRAMSNPLVIRDGMENTVTDDPEWVYRRFVSPAPGGNVIIRRPLRMSDGTTEDHTLVYLPAKLSDNPDKEFVRQYEATLRSKPAHIRRALLDGDWNAIRGAYFGDDWDEAIHTCRPFRIPNTWRRFRSMDWGYKSPGCVGWWALDDDGTLWCEKEFTFQGMIDKDVAVQIKIIELDLGLWRKGKSLITGPADTQLWERRGDSGKSKAQVFADKGVEWVAADKGPGSKVSNSQKLLFRLKDHDHGASLPGIIYFSTCTNCIRSIPRIGTDPHNSEAPADGGEDHWLDMTLYACGYASHGKVGIPKMKNEEEDFEDRPRKKREKREYGYGT